MSTCVINRLKNRDNTAGDFLAKLRGKRTEADYKMEIPIGENTAKLCVRLSNEILKHLSEMK